MGQIDIDDLIIPHSQYQQGRLRQMLRRSPNGLMRCQIPRDLGNTLTMMVKRGDVIGFGRWRLKRYYLAYRVEGWEPVPKRRRYRVG